MKIKIIPLLLTFFIGMWITPQKTDAQVSFQIFYDNLTPYGHWVNNPAYGYVWVPRVSHGFRPYGTNGYWVWTDYGWTWVSNYPWGWAPFHYGRWFYDDNYGEWIWVPDDEWGPAWVSWRSSDDYYGWAPIGPGVSIDIAFTNAYDLPYNRWTFVPTRYFGRPDVNNYFVSNTNNVTIINNTTIINNPHVDRTRNTRFNAGPDRTEVEKHVGRPITPVAIKETDKPAQRVAGNQLEIYRPQVQKNNANGGKPAPAKVENLKDVKRPIGNNDNLILPKVENQPRQNPTLQKNNPPNKVQDVQQPKAIKEQPVQRRKEEQPIQQQRINPPVKQQPIQRERVQPIQQQRVNPPVKQQPMYQERQPQPIQQQRVNPPVKQQPVQQERQQQPIQQQRINPPVRQQPVQRPRDQQPPVQQQPRMNPPAFQGPPQQQNPKQGKEQPAPKQKKGGG